MKKNLTLLAFILSLVLYFSVIQGYRAEGVNQALKIKELEQSIRLVKAEYEGLQSQETEKGASLDLAFQKIPKGMQQESVIRDLQKISQNSGFTFNELNFGKSFNGELNTPQLSVSFSVRGPFPQLFPFLRFIEKNERFFEMNDLQLSFSEENGTRQVSTDITLYALYQDE